MASTIMMQNMCNNQDPGMYGSHNNQIYYGSTYETNPTYAPALPSPAISPDCLPAGGRWSNPQTLAMPPMNYSGGVSPQMMPMGYPAYSSQMMPMLDMNMPSVSPPPMGHMSGLMPAVPMMGYSMLPIPQTGMTLVGLPPASGSLSPEPMRFLMPEMVFSNGGSISRSCSPSPSDDVVLPNVSGVDHHVQEVTRERLPSVGSNSSIDSNGMISKKELVESCLNQIDQIFGNRVQTTGMRGPTVMRIKVKTRPALELIVNLLKALEQNCTITAISCPKSTKKGKQHIRGFLAYIQTNHVANIPRIQCVFDEFNRAHTNGEAAPFKTLEVNPQKKK